MKPVETEEGPIYIPDGDSHFNMRGDKLLNYQRDVYDCARDYTKERRVAIDIGAHVGIWTRRMERDFKGVIAFEPQPENFRCLAANTKTAILMQMALSNGISEGSLRLPAPDNSGSWELDDGGEGVLVNMLSSFGLDNVDLIKIDAQGSDLKALEGAWSTILRWRPVLVVETKQGGKRDENIEKFLARLGYESVSRFNKDDVFVWTGK